jgi:hypothetical protein
MDGLSLLTEALDGGLDVQADGERLVIRGPKQAEPLARRLLARKADVLAALMGNVEALDPDPAEFDVDLGHGPEHWRERIVDRRGRKVRLLERLDPPPRFPGLDFETLPERGLGDKPIGAQ